MYCRQRHQPGIIRTIFLLGVLCGVIQAAPVIGLVLIVAVIVKAIGGGK